MGTATKLCEWEEWLCCGRRSKKFIRPNKSSLTNLLQQEQMRHQFHTYIRRYINHHSSQKAFSCIPTFAIQCTDTLTINSNNFVWLLCEMKFLHYIVFFLVVFAAKLYGARPKGGKVRKEPFFFLMCLSMLQEPWCNLPKKRGPCEMEGVDNQPLTLR